MTDLVLMLILIGPIWAFSLFCIIDLGVDYEYSGRFFTWLSKNDIDNRN